MINHSTGTCGVLYRLMIHLSLALAVGVAAASAGESEALLIVYPDYPVDTDTAYGYTKLVGHAGVLLISETGVTKYYEYGRYDAAHLGVVRQVTIPDVEIKEGMASKESLKKVLMILSDRSGKKGRIRAAYFINMDFAAMNDYATQQKNTTDPQHPKHDPNRKKFSVSDHNCGHFAEQVILKGHPMIDRPLIINPTPNNLVDEYIEEKNAEVLFNPIDGSLKIGVGDETDAKK